jgi:ribonuclease J
MDSSSNPQPNQPQPSKPGGQRRQGGANQPRPPRTGTPSSGSAQKQSGGPKRGGGGRRNGRNSGPLPSKLMPALDYVPVNRSEFAPPEKAKAAAPQPSQNRVANVITREPKLRIIPLGGLGEVGKNMMAIEYENDIIVIDMGFMFPTDDQPGIDYVIPNTSYLEQRKHKIRGMILTHGHEDHMGGIPFVWPKLGMPIYTARFSAGMVEKKLTEYRIQPPIRVLDPDKHERVQLGVFNVELVRVTHSIPDACGVAIETPVGTIFHTGDFRFDPHPIDGKVADKDRLKELGDKGVLLLLSDSTSCERMGRTPSEREIEPSFEDLFSRQTGRIIISTFASQINRVQLIVDAAHATGRKLAFTGRSMLANVELAVKLGYLRVPVGLIVRVQDISRLPDRQVVVLCTGSQGEVNSALVRMSTGDHPHIKIKPGDAVIMSSNPIPGNEKSVVTSVDSLLREGSKVYQHLTRELDECGILHVSGHASRDELVEMMQLVKPKYFVPQHGEFHMLVRHAELMVKNGMPKENVFVLDNGDVLEISSRGAQRGERVPAGVIMIDGTGVGDVEGVVLRDRLAMANEGIFMIVATVDRRTGKLVSSPDIISRGFIYMKENEELVNRARAEIRKLFEQRSTREPTDWSKFKLRVRDEISDFLYSRTHRNPMIVTVINEV